MQSYHSDAEIFFLSFFCLFFFLVEKGLSFHLTFTSLTLFALLETVMLHLVKHQMTCGGRPVVLPRHNKTFPRQPFQQNLHKLGLKMVSDMSHLS